MYIAQNNNTSTANIRKQSKQDQSSSNGIRGKLSKQVKINSQFKLSSKH
jgi:hypothetical protein